MQTTALTAPATLAQVPNLRALAMRAIGAAFSSKAFIIVAGIVAAMMYFHFITIVDTIAMQRAIATDCLYAAPWALARLIRSIRKGGSYARI